MAAQDRLREAVQAEVSARIAALPADEPGEEAVKALIDDAVSELAESGEYGEIPAAEERRLADAIADDMLRYGPLQPLLDDPGVTEIMCNGVGYDEGGALRHEVWTERGGRLAPEPGVAFEGEEHVQRIMNKICGQSGRHIDQSNPIVDAALPDGSRFNGTIWPIAKDGSSFNIRKFRDDMLGWRSLVEMGSMTRREAEFLKACVVAGCNILVAGGTGSGKTTFLNMLSGFVDGGERIMVVEDTSELLIHRTHRHTQRFESRPANSEGSGAVTLDDNLVAVLRKRPDRIIVGECRGREAYTMLEAMNTGHDGGMSTIHANSAKDAIVRLLTLAFQHPSCGFLSEKSVLAKIGSGIDLVVYLKRFPDGTRRVTEIEAVGGFSDGVVQRDRLWEFEVEGVDGDGRYFGSHRALGVQPGRIRRKIEDIGGEWNLAWTAEEGD